MITWINYQGQLHMSPLNTSEEGPIYEHYKVQLGVFPKYIYKSIFKDTTQLSSNFCRLLMHIQFKPWFPHINLPRLTG